MPAQPSWSSSRPRQVAAEAEALLVGEDWAAPEPELTRTSQARSSLCVPLRVLVRVTHAGTRNITAGEQSLHPPCSPLALNCDAPYPRFWCNLE